MPLKMLNILRWKYAKPWIHGVEDILLGFEPKDAGSIPAGSVSLDRDYSLSGMVDLFLNQDR